MQYPQWATRPGTKKQRASMKLKFLIRFAALHHNEQGSVRALARDMGISEMGLVKAAQRGYLTSGMAALLEDVVGADVLSREYLTAESLVR